MASRPRGLAASLPSLLDLGRNGALLSIRTGLLLVSFTVAASVATRLGTTEIAAHQLVGQIFLFTALLADSFAVAAQALVGEASGEGDAEAVHLLNRRLMAWGAITGVLLLLLVWSTRGALGFLASDDAVAALAISVALIVALAEPIASILFVADGIFLGLLGFGLMAVSTGIGALVAIGLMLFSPLGDTVQGFGGQSR